MCDIGCGCVIVVVCVMVGWDNVRDCVFGRGGFWDDDCVIVFLCDFECL